MFEHIGEEFRGAALGDARLSARLERIGEALSLQLILLIYAAPEM